MEKFNQVLTDLGSGGDGQCPCKDTDSDIGTAGEINSPEESQDKVIIHLGGGIEISMPLAVAKMIAKALTGEQTSDDGE